MTNTVDVALRDLIRAASMHGSLQIRPQEFDAAIQRAVDALEDNRRLEPVLIDTLQRIYAVCSGAVTGSALIAFQLADEALGKVQEAQKEALK
jgi:lipopolysaccharide biosynthesis regulator YciM